MPAATTGPNWCAQASPAGVGQAAKEETALAGAMGGNQRIQKAPADRRESTRTGRQNPRLQAIQRLPSGDRPPLGTPLVTVHRLLSHRNCDLPRRTLPDKMVFYKKGFL